MLRSASIVALLASAALIAAPAASGKVAKNPENDKSLGPTKSAGYFLGFPSPTDQWHGCRKSDTQQGPRNLVDNSLNTEKSTSRYVRFTVNEKAYPTYTWKVKPGWKICGVQVAVQLTNPDVGSDLLAEAGYTSGPSNGATRPGDGRETIKVKIPAKGIRAQGFEEFEGKTFSIQAFQSVTVFVKR